LRAGAVFLLAAFLVQTGEGLSALACYDDASRDSLPSLAHHGEHDHWAAGDGHPNDPAPAGSHDHAHDNSHAPDDGPCPMGAVPGLMCGASATAPPPPVLGASLTASTQPLQLADPTAAVDRLSPLNHFRPPRA
jgi:hypothetical protein